MRRVRPASLLAIFLSLSACTTDPVTRERKVSYTMLQGMGGAAVGATIGALNGVLPAHNAARDTGRNIVLSAAAGAAIGGAAGAAHGAAVDKYEAGLLQEFAAAGVQITERGTDAILEVQGGLSFEKNSAQPTYKVEYRLREIGLILTHYQRHQIDVVGHTSSEEDPQLSEWRASMASNILIRMGVTPSRIPSSGRGDTEATRAANQRVEIFLTPGT